MSTPITTEDIVSRAETPLPHTKSRPTIRVYPALFLTMSVEVASRLVTSGASGEAGHA